MALQAFKELASYFNDRFTGSPQIYIIKSNERDYLHCFIDYKDKTSYKKSEEAYFVDAEWDTKLRQFLGLYAEDSYQYVVYKSIATIAAEAPVADLSKGQEGGIYFTSINLGSFREILAGEGESKPITVFGTLSIPKSTKGKVPAVVIMHGAGGVNDHYFEVARILKGIGIAAFIVDSWETRGIHSVRALKGKKLPHSFAFRISDAYAALELLSTHPKINKRKIALMGYSHGGSVALFVASKKIRYSFIADDLRFAASIAYYPFCFPQIKDIDFTGARILMLLAEKDNMAPAKSCLDYARRIKDSGADINTIVYKNAHHQFPVLPGKKMIQVPELADLSDCGQNEYWFLQNDGIWYSSYLKKTFAEVDPGYTYTDCMKDGGAIVGGNEEAKAKSINEFKIFLKKVFDLR